MVTGATARGNYRIWELAWLHESWAEGYAPAMPRPPGQRRSTNRLFDAQPKDDQADDAAILDPAQAAQAKRARRRQRARGALEWALDVLAHVLGSGP